MSDATPAPATSDETAAVSVPIDDGNAVDFVIGGHSFSVPVPTLWHAKAMPGSYLSAAAAEEAERAIELVVASSEEAAAFGKETLMRGCSLGEAVKLGESLRRLYERAGMPMAAAPPASDKVAAA